MQEKDFHSKFKHCLEADGFWLHKFYDTPGSRFTLQKPFDFIAVKDGKAYAFELKIMKSFKKLSKTDFVRGKEKNVQEIKDNWLECNQIKSLLNFHEHGGKSFIVTNIWIKDLRLSEVVFTPITTVIDAENLLARSGKEWEQIALSNLNPIHKNIFKINI